MRKLDIAIVATFGLVVTAGCGDGGTSAEQMVGTSFGETETTATGGLVETGGSAGTVTATGATTGTGLSTGSSGSSGSSGTHDGPLDVESCVLGGIRSDLYPDDWQPGDVDDQGRFLHDFSYAGYHNGEQEPPSGSFTQVFDVSTAPYNVDTTGSVDSTAGIQAAIDAASVVGGIVYLPAGTYRASKLTISALDVVLRGAGPELTKIWFADGGNKHNIELEGDAEFGTVVALTEDAEPWATKVLLENVQGLAVGDHFVIRP